jgi:hypothetical protein
MQAKPFISHNMLKDNHFWRFTSWNFVKHAYYAFEKLKFSKYEK